MVLLQITFDFPYQSGESPSGQYVLQNVRQDPMGKVGYPLKFHKRGLKGPLAHKRRRRCVVPVGVIS